MAKKKRRTERERNTLERKSTLKNEKERAMGQSFTNKAKGKKKDSALAGETEAFS